MFSHIFLTSFVYVIQLYWQAASRPWYNWYQPNFRILKTVYYVSYHFFIQNSSSSADNSEMESLRKECELATKKCKDAQEKYFSESDRLKAIIDEMQGMVLLAFILGRLVTLEFEIQIN